jgi:hypothetical protein
MQTVKEYLDIQENIDHTIGTRDPEQLIIDLRLCDVFPQVSDGELIKQIEAWQD